MFNSILKNIYKKIHESKKPHKLGALTSLEKRVLSNDILKHQFENYVLFTEAKHKKEAFKEINKRNKLFLEEKKVCCCQIKKENKKLAEFFNIDTRKLGPTKIDLLLELKINNKKEKLKENFDNIGKKKNRKALTRKLKIVNFLAEGLENNNVYVQKCISKLRSMIGSDINIAAKKTLQLHETVEKLLKEYAKSEIQEQTGDEHKLKSLTHIRDIVVTFPTNKVDKVVISFKVPVYPEGAHFSDINKSVRDITRNLDGLERKWINRSIYRAGRINMFNPVGSIWDSNMSRTTGLQPGSVVFYEVDFYIHSNINSSESIETYKSQIHKMLREFEVLLLEYYPLIVDKLYQQEVLKQKTSSRKTEYDKRTQEEKQLSDELKDDFNGAF